jgi:hypothetical protein
MARTPREVWAKRVERWRASDLTAKEFAAEIGVNDRTLTYWKWILGKEAAARPPARRRRGGEDVVKFTELAVEPTALMSGSPIEIVVEQGLVIRVDRQFDEDTLRRVLGVVRVSA